MKHQRLKVNICRLMALFMLCSALTAVFAFPASAVESGACGDGLTWVLNAGTLSIKGSGKMTDYRSSELPPWYEFREEIVRLDLSSEVTSIGNYAFYGCEELVAISIPNSVKSIGNYAFASCERLTSVQGAGSVSAIGKGAFYNCYSLEAIRLPYGLSELEDQAFYRCEALRSIYVPSDVRTMGDSVFAYCKSLVRAEIHARISELPRWTFYGCEQLSEVYLYEGIKNIGNFGFKKCSILSTVYYKGSDAQTKELDSQISDDVNGFAVTGYFSKSDPPTYTTSGKSDESADNALKFTNTTVLQDNSTLISYEVEHVYSLISTQKGSCHAKISVTIDRKEVWDSAIESVAKILKDVGETYSNISELMPTEITVYLEKDVELSSAFLTKLMGRDIFLTVVSAGGSRWKLNCKDLVINDEASDQATTPTVSKNYSHNLYEAPEEVCEKLGTDDCYRLTFEESVEQKAEVLVQLPPQTAVNTNAFLYEVDESGEYHKLQAVAVDNDGYAHLYIASVEVGHDYIIGLDVPGEDTSDVIIPDTLVGTGAISAIERLEVVEYVELGRVSSLGVSAGGITWILIGVLVGTTVLVGGIMLVFNKLQLAKKAKAKS